MKSRMKSNRHRKKVPLMQPRDLNMKKATEIEIKIQRMKRIDTTVDESLFKSEQVTTVEYPSV